VIDFSGVLVPLLTPFTDDMSAVSEVRLVRFIRRLMDRGASGFVIGTHAGEFCTLSPSERKHVLELVMRETHNAVPVLVHVSTLFTMSALDIAQHAGRHGARGVILMPPYYGRFTVEEVVHHFKTVANYCNLSVITLDLPGLELGDLWPTIEEHRGIRRGNELSTKWPAHGLTTPYPTSDEFTAYDVVVSPLGLVFDQALKEAPGEEAKPFAEAMRKYGVAKLAKAYLDAMDFNIGPPRVPLQLIPIQELKT